MMFLYLMDFLKIRNFNKTIFTGEISYKDSAAQKPRTLFWFKVFIPMVENIANLHFAYNRKIK